MPTPLATMALRLPLCAAAATGLYLLIGSVGLVLSAPILGFALARPLIELLGDAHHGIKAAAYAKVEGRYYAFHGQPIDIAEDERHHRWLSVADLRKVLPGLPRDALLQQVFGSRVQADRITRALRVEAEALHAHLERATEPESLRFRSWLGKEIVFPAAKRRERLRAFAGQ